MKQAVLAALDCGYRHIDCAAAYGNEREVGEALTELLGPGKVPADKTIYIIAISRYESINTAHHNVPHIVHMYYS